MKRLAIGIAMLVISTSLACGTITGPWLSSYDCHELAEMAVELSAEKNTNPRVRSISRVSETYRSSHQVECAGEAHLSSGYTRDIIVHAEKKGDSLQYGYRSK